MAVVVMSMAELSRVETLAQVKHGVLPVKQAATVPSRCTPIPRAATARPRRTRCWRGTAANGRGSSDADQARGLRRRRHDGDHREGADPATIAAAHRLREAGIPLALVSSRPPRGMGFLTADLALTGPLGGFNGGTILAPDGVVIEERLVPEDAVRESLALLAEHGVRAWLFADNEWLVEDPDSDYVPKERRTVRFEPTVVADFGPYLARCGKVVGASAKFDVLAECERALQAKLGHRAHAHRSQRYYLDVTNASADKGTAAHAFATWYGVDIADVFAIGDQHNDVPMFKVAGHSIAMGNAPPAVAAEAKRHAGSNDEDGWAKAIDAFVLTTAG